MPRGDQGTVVVPRSVPTLPHLENISPVRQQYFLLSPPELG